MNSPLGTIGRISRPHLAAVVDSAIDRLEDTVQEYQQDIGAFCAYNQSWRATLEIPCVATRRKTKRSFFERV